MKVSVLIPVYNKRRHVEQCLKSILEQDFDDFEAIAVDDGSTDGSAEICDRLAAVYPRLRVKHITNGGVTRARRTAYEMSTGEYITFADADDRMRPGALRTLYDTIVREEADEVVATYHNQHGVHKTTGITGQVDPTWMLARLCGSKARFCILWGVIFRRRLLEGCLDDAGVIIRSGEDRLMQMLCLVKRPKVVFIPDSVYTYYEGITRRNLGDVADMQRAYDEVLRKAFAPRWDELKDLYTLRQVKIYEHYIYLKRFEVFDQYFRHVRKQLNSNIPLADRIVMMLPPRLARILIVVRKWLVNR